ncbi:alkaline phosphatase family protein [Palleronia caenipelagi]|uniref:Alkaline phosphatase family protein n=2 Tax=Palleronia caenipelagi TaxID=2489174 RepID=A0A547Q2T7_9RHOB|nr:alkaline phosphatase family protein [Palleronia caenipelagi]
MSIHAIHSGPMLFLRAAEGGALRLAVTCLRPADSPAPVIRTTDRVPVEALTTRAGTTLWRSEIVVTESHPRYEVDGTAYEVAIPDEGDMTVAFTSCNGQERGDLDRSEEERNLMWARLHRRMGHEPVHLLLHGGDQIYADEVTESHPLSAKWPDEVPEEISAAERHDLRETLANGFFLRYATQRAQAGYGDVVSRVPSLCMWDDHDICDGWGSLPQKAQNSELATILFEAAREAFLLFQFGCRGDEHPEICSGRTSAFSWRMDLPGLSVIAPDLRSTRTKRQVMDAHSWADLDSLLHSTEAQTLLISSVPALGPRLSWVERAMKLTRRMEEYEDDLRDQWQSYAHRDEWCRFLRALMAVHDGEETSLAVLSGEIHLAMRATMKTDTGHMHQLVASGISHPAPPEKMAIALSWLARLGEAPLKGHPIRMHPLPGQTRPYVAQRNYLLLRRREGQWAAVWDLEDSGETDPLPI